MPRDYRVRRKGSRNSGFSFRDGRGWFAKDKLGRIVPLEVTRDRIVPHVRMASK